MAEEINKEEVALRRAALFNVKVRNMGIKDILKHDYKKEKELDIEREQLTAILSTNTKIKNIDEILLNPKTYNKEVNKNEKHNKYNN